MKKWSMLFLLAVLLTSAMPSPAVAQLSATRDAQYIAVL